VCNLTRFFQALYKKLNAQQFGLKMIANVTYGYTSANFSGRMPCVEVLLHFILFLYSLLLLLLLFLFHGCA